ncbi:MAG: hypothetical protein NTU61_02010 [Candidatus Altiarchaeota archaeon]|nr:hypothetical protein [Candidatus Altiarchaeota archaeon]
MAKKDKLSDFEEDVVNYYMEEYIRNVELGKDSSMDELTRLIDNSRYGGNYRPRIPTIDWNQLFNKHVCPLCSDLISMGGKEYACGKCNFRIPLELYDKAIKHYETEIELTKNGVEYSKKIADKKLSKERIDELYNTGLDRAASKLAEKDKETENKK